MTPEEARERFASARCVRLATADADGRRHIVPLVFALDGDTVYRYGQYVDAPPDGPVLAVEVQRWSGWAA